ncbi:MAG: ROK family protein [Parachlamydiales bacterium]
MVRWAVGVDLGGTKVEVAQIDASGHLLEALKFPTHPKEGSAAIEQAIADGIAQLEKKIGSEPVGVGVGVAGQVEKASGAVLFAPNLQWHNVPLQHDLHEALDLPVVVVNDVRAATWGEYLHGAGRGTDDLVCLFIGTGIGGGVVANGSVLRGASNTAGELGHTVVDLHGPICKCGNTGCVEAIAGGASIARRAREAIEAHPEEGKALLKLAGETEQVITQHVIEAFRKNDPLATRLIEEAKEALIASCTSFINAFGPSRLILGGGVTQGLPELIEWIEAGVRKRALKAATNGLTVHKATLGNHAGVVGAGALALREFG